VFIVLSGFSLALSPARHGWRLEAVSRFAQRRGPPDPSGLPGGPSVQPRQWRGGSRLSPGTACLTIVFARVFMAVFEFPFLTQRTWSHTARVPQPSADGVAG
jgi:hypothetical protein